jgi:hypothetical protein
MYLYESPRPSIGPKTFRFNLRLSGTLRLRLGIGGAGGGVLLGIRGAGGGVLLGIRGAGGGVLLGIGGAGGAVRGALGASAAVANTSRTRFRPRCGSFGIGGAGGAVRGRRGGSAAVASTSRIKFRPRGGNLGIGGAGGVGLICLIGTDAPAWSAGRTGGADFLAVGTTIAFGGADFLAVGTTFAFAVGGCPGGGDRGGGDRGGGRGGGGMLGGYPNVAFVSIFGATGVDAFPAPRPRLLSAEAPVGSGPATAGLGTGVASIAR